MGVLGRTWALMGASWRVLMLDKELLLFALLLSEQIRLRRLDGWRELAQRPADDAPRAA